MQPLKLAISNLYHTLKTAIDSDLEGPTKKVKGPENLVRGPGNLIVPTTFNFYFNPWTEPCVVDVEETVDSVQLYRTTCATVLMVMAVTINSSVSIRCCWSLTSRPAIERRTRALRHQRDLVAMPPHYLHHRLHHPAFLALTSIPHTPRSTRPAPCWAPPTQLPVQSPLRVAEFRPEVTTRLTWPPAAGDLILRYSPSSTYTRAQNFWSGAMGKSITMTMTSAKGIPEVEWDVRPVVRWFSASLHLLSSRQSNNVTIRRQASQRSRLTDIWTLGTSAHK